MAIKISNAFLTKLQMTSGNLNIFEDFAGTAAIISGSNLGGVVSSYTLLADLDASDVSSYGGSGTTWTDLAGSNNGSLQQGTGTLTYTATAGGAFDFSGGSNTRINLGNTSDLQLSTTTSKAFSVWFKADAVGFISFSKTILSKVQGLGGSATTDGFWMGISSSNQLVARVASDNGATQKALSGIGATISTGTWYMATLIVKVSPDADTFKLFINSTQVGSTNGGGTSLSSDTQDFLLGNYGTGVQNAQAFDGMIGEFYVHSGAFGATEVTTLFDNTKTRFGY